MRFIFLFTCFLQLSFYSFSQLTQIDSLQSEVDKSYGKAKLIALNALTNAYLKEQDERRALRYARQAKALADEIIVPDNELITEADWSLKPESYSLYAIALYRKSDYYDAKKAFEELLVEARRQNIGPLMREATAYLNILDSLAAEPGIIGKMLKGVSLGGFISNSTNDMVLSTTLKLAQGYENRKNYEAAIAQYQKAVNLLSNKGRSTEVLAIQQKIAALYELSGRYEEAIAQYKAVRSVKERSKDTTVVADIDNNVEQIIRKLDQVITSSETKNHRRPRVRSKEELASDNLLALAREFENKRDFEKSLSYYKLYHDALEKMEEEEHQQELLLLEKANQLEQKASQLTLLEQEKELQRLQMEQQDEALKEQHRFRNNLIVILLLLSCLLVALYLLYRYRKRSHVKLQRAYEHVDNTRKRLQEAEGKIKTLLNQQLSGAVASELMEENPSGKIAERFVCIMFLDIRDFTPFAEKCGPEEIIEYQNNVFSFMIDIVQANHGIINQFLGDGFMATFGAPVSAGNDCQNAFNAARAILLALEEKNAQESIPPTRVGIGLHAGNVVTGNVGTEVRKQYSITGNAVILAARIEQLNKLYGTQLLVSQEVVEHLDAPAEAGGEVEVTAVKGRKEPIRVYKAM